MSDSTAKLKVTVKLHQQSLTELPELTPPPSAPISVVRLAVAVAVILLAAYGGRWLYQQWPHNDIDYAAYAAPKDEPTTVDDVEPAAMSATTASVSHETDTQPKPAVASNNLKVASLTSSSEKPAAQMAAKTVQQAVNIVQAAQKAAPGTVTKAPDMLTSSSAAALQDNPALPTGFRRILLTAQMERLEPGAPVAEPVPFASVKRVYLFTEIEGFAGQHLRHRWYWNNQFQYEARLTVEDTPWRTYSEKWLLDDQRGAWRVEIVDQAQNVLYQHDFSYQ